MFFRRARAFCPAPSRYVLKESSGDGTEQAEDQRFACFLLLTIEDFGLIVLYCS